MYDCISMFHSHVVYLLVKLRGIKNLNLNCTTFNVVRSVACYSAADGPELPFVCTNNKYLVAEYKPHNWK